MKGSLASRRYAKSLLVQAASQGATASVQDDMQLIATTVNENKELQNALQSPIITIEKKQALLKAIFGEKVTALSSSFIQLVVEKNRAALLPSIAEAYIAAYKTQQGITQVEVISAIALDDQQKNNITALLAQKGIANIEMTEKVDPDLLGGFIVRYGDHQIDASIVRKLNDLKQELI